MKTLKDCKISGTTEHKGRALKRYFNGIPVRDALADIKIVISKEDIEAGIRNDPCSCAFALALRRQYNAKEVWVYNSIAYVELIDEHGKPVMERFQLKTSPSRFRESFDKGEAVTLGGFIFSKPRASYSLDAKDKYNVERKDKAHRPNHGTISGKKSNGGTEHRRLNLDRRPGTGKVHFL